MSKMNEGLKKISLVLLDFVETLILATVFLVIFWAFLGQPHQVRGNSMTPTLHDNEYLLTEKISYMLGQPQRGDVIIFRFPQAPRFDYIKRIIGLPGEKLKIQNNKITIQNTEFPAGFVMDEPYLANGTQTIVPPSGAFMSEGQMISLGKNEYFVLGDNRQNSSDSRFWGLVPRNEIIGKTFFRFFPLTAFGPIQSTSFASKLQ